MLNTSTPTEIKREKTQLVLMNIYNLPPIPKVISDALSLLDSKSTNVSELNRVISKDQSLVSKILLIANSPFYGLQRKVTSVEFAILILGFAEIRSIVTVLSLIESFKNKTDKFLDQKEFWLHSFLAGTVTKRLAEDLDFPNPGEAFIAGFLHDMGVSVMHRFFHTGFMQICNMVESENISYEHAEIEVLGMTHQQIGNYLIERWNFPQVMCDAILYHHNPGESKNNIVLSSLIHLADYMTQKLGIGNFKWDKNMTFSEDAMHALRFNSDEALEEFIQGYKTLFVNQSESIKYLS